MTFPRTDFDDLLGAHGSDEKFENMFIPKHRMIFFDETGSIKLGPEIARKELVEKDFIRLA
jgi:hypothetical protein